MGSDLISDRYRKERIRCIYKTSKGQEKLLGYD